VPRLDALYPAGKRDPQEERVKKMANESHPPATSGPVALLIGTKKGAFVLRGDSRRARWELSEPIFLGHVVHHVVRDPRDERTVLLAARTGHLGPTVFRSTNGGRTWEEAARPPAFAKAAGGDTESGRVVDHVFWLSPGHAREAGVWYAGTSPQGLFRTEDGGRTWQGVGGFNDHPMRAAWCGSGQDGTPDGPKMHSILVDPRDPRHMYIGMSSGGVFESTDLGHDWRPLNQGCAMDYNPGPPPEFGHDPHRVVLHPLRPDRLYQQNHCGIYCMERPEGRWVRIGDNMPRDVGDIGFPIVVHPRDPDVVWVFPMDGTDVWPRTSPGGRPAAYVTRDAGATWRRQDDGLPSGKAWFTVLRQAMAADHHAPVGIYFGTTGGEVWGSDDEGERWRCLVRHLPQIYAVEVAESLG
jgi:photosystem II stability/assembly factor-like uncharacterized protein